MKLIYLKSASKYDSFDVIIGIKIPFFRVSVTIEPGLLSLFTTVRYHELFDKFHQDQLYPSKVTSLIKFASF